MLLPIATAVARALLDGWFPLGDNALLVIRAYDVGTVHHPLLGSWTSASLALGVDVNNPGPLYFNLASPFMWTFGRVLGIGPATAIAIGSINAAAGLGTVLVAARMGGWRAERWMLLLVAGLTWSMGSELLFDIWQPHALLLPFCLLLVLTIAVASGDVRLLPVWIAVASLIVQTHVAYMYVVGVLVLIVAASLVGRFRERHEDDETLWSRVRRALPRPVVVWTVVVLAVAWAQPVWEQFFGRGEGNLQRLATNAGGGDITLGAGTAVRAVAAVTALPPWWTRYGYVDSVPSTGLTQTAEGARLIIPGLPDPVVAVLSVGMVFAVLALLIVVLRHPAQRHARMASVVSIGALVVAVGGLTIQAVTVGGFGSHQARWLFALALFVHVAILWGAVEWAAQRWPGARPLGRGLDVGIAVVVAALTLANLPFYAHDLGPTTDRAAGRTLARTFEDLDRFDPGGPVIFDTDNLRVYEPYSPVVMMRLREIGIEFRFEDGPLLRQFGEGRLAEPSDRIHLRQFEGISALLYAGDGCVVSLRSAVSPADEATVDDLVAAAAEDLVSSPSPVDVSGMFEETGRLVTSAVDGSDVAARRVAMSPVLLSRLVDEERVTVTPALQAAADARVAIADRVDTTLLVAATPASVCSRQG